MTNRTKTTDDNLIYTAQEWFLLSIGLASVFFVYSVPLFNDLIWDDRMMIKNYSGLGDPEQLWKMISSPFWFNSTYMAQQLTSFWRPLTSLLLWFGGALFGKWAPGFHSLSILAALGSAFSLFLIVRKTSWSDPSLKTSPWIAIFFAIHPFAAEVISLVANISDHLVFVFVTAQTLMFHKAHFFGNRLLCYFLAGICAFFACCSKELGLLCIGAPLATYLLFKHKDGQIVYSTVKNIGPWIASILPAVLYLFLRHLVMSHSDRPFTIVEDPSVYLKSLFLGYGQLIYQALVPIPRGTYLGVGHDIGTWLLSIALWLVSIVLLLFLRKKHFFNICLAGFLFSFAFLVPSFLAVEEIKGELTLHTRYFHLPFAGLLIALFPLLSRLWRSGLKTVFPLFALLLALLSWVRVSEWKDHLTLFTAEVAYNPRSKIGLINKVEALMQTGNFKKTEEAIDAAENILGQSPRILNARARLVAQRDRDWEAATDYLVKALKADPTNLSSVIDLANVRIEAGHPEQALIILEKAKKAPWFQDQRKRLIEACIDSTKKILKNKEIAQ